MARAKNLAETVPKLARIWRRFWPYTRKQLHYVVGAVFAVTIQVFMRLLEPWPLKFIFDGVIFQNLNMRGFPLAGNFVQSIVGAMAPLTLLTVSVIALVVIVGVRAITWYYANVGFAIIGTRVTTEIQNDLYQHVQRLPLSFHTKARGGDLIVRIIADISMIREVVVTAALPLFASIFALVAMFVVMFWLNSTLAFVSLIVLPLFWLSTRRIMPDITETSRRQRTKQSAIASTASESIGAIQVVQALSLEDRFLDDFRQENKANLGIEVRGARLAARLERSLDVFIALGMSLVLYFGTQFVLSGALTPGDLLVFVAYLRTAYRPFQDFAKYTSRLAKAAAAGERVIDVMDRTPDIRDRPDAVPAPSLRGEVAFEVVTFAYEPGHPVLSDVSIQVTSGQLVVLVGPSGIGKSTVASLLLRLYDPQAGRVTFDGQDIRRFKIESLRQQLSVVLQDTLLFHATARENIAFGAPNADPKEIEACARLANAHEFIMALPLGYDTVFGERGVT
ncbi:MAG TPA: ABC transporter ATP-binding protein, partial [Thermoplasmata archaeon]|nr:ABC transporter ATP-binding protein [Thermoplasmata archaeon]